MESESSSIISMGSDILLNILSFATYEDYKSWKFVCKDIYCKFKIYKIRNSDVRSLPIDEVKFYVNTIFDDSSLGDIEVCGRSIIANICMGKIQSIKNFNYAVNIVDTDVTDLSGHRDVLKIENSKVCMDTAADTRKIHLHKCDLSIIKNINCEDLKLVNSTVTEIRDCPRMEMITMNSSEIYRIANMPKLHAIESDNSQNRGTRVENCENLTSTGLTKITSISGDLINTLDQLNIHIIGGSVFPNNIDVRKLTVSSSAGYSVGYGSSVPIMEGRYDMIKSLVYLHAPLITNYPISLKCIRTDIPSIDHIYAILSNPNITNISLDIKFNDQLIIPYYVVYHHVKSLTITSHSGVSINTSSFPNLEILKIHQNVKGDDVRYNWNVGNQVSDIYVAPNCNVINMTLTGHQKYIDVSKAEKCEFLVIKPLYESHVALPVRVKHAKLTGCTVQVHRAISMRILEMNGCTLDTSELNCNKLIKMHAKACNMTGRLNWGNSKIDQIYIDSCSMDHINLYNSSISKFTLINTFAHLNQDRSRIHNMNVKLSNITMDGNFTMCKLTIGRGPIPNINDLSWATVKTLIAPYLMNEEKKRLTSKCINLERFDDKDWDEIYSK